MATIEQMKEKQREIGLLLCWLMHVNPYDVLQDEWDLSRTWAGPIWTYLEIQRDEKGRIERREDGSPKFIERMVLLPMDVYTAVLESL